MFPLFFFLLSHVLKSLEDTKKAQVQCSNGLVLIESPPFFHFALSYSLNFPISYLKTRLLLKDNSAQVIL